MKHAIIIDKPDTNHENCIEVRLTKDCNIYLAEVDYSQEELETFHSEAKNWILECSGSMQFTADYENGEDAQGTYREYFDLTEQTAIFDNGKFVGFYVCPGGFDYSGNGRASFTIDKWRFYDPFQEQSCVKDTHVVLFEREETYRWEHWDVWALLKRDPYKKYTGSLGF
jgi:hypothetical protein